MITALLKELRLNLRDLRLMFERREIINKPPWDKKTLTMTYYEWIECLIALEDVDTEHGRSALEKIKRLWDKPIQQVRTDGITCWED